MLSSVSSPSSRVDESLGGSENTAILLEELQEINEEVVHRFQTEGKQTAIVSNLDLLLLSLSLWLCCLCHFSFGLSFD